jgi:hypothetical protein
MQPAAAAPPFASRTAELPLCPPATCVNVTPGLEPDAFQPEISASKVALPTMPGPTLGPSLDAPETTPSVSVTIT